MKNQIKTLGGGGIKSLNPHHAFTLAEVLITLAIIGIVAALTIPTLVAKNEKKQLYTQFMKSYNTISNALNLAMIDHGDPITWKTSKDGNSDYIKTYLSPYLKDVKVCEKMTDCTAQANAYTDLEGNSAYERTSAVEAANPYTIQLPDGTTMFQVPGSYALAFDINGPKGPNVFGRDMLIIFLTWTGSKESCSGKPICFSTNSQTCLETKGIFQDRCVQQLLQEGAMNY